MQNNPPLSIFTIANVITALRILATPVFFFLLIQQERWAYVWALFLFVAAAVTDLVDGILARHFGETTEFGIFLDPLADKILVLSALFGFVWLDIVPLWMVIVVAIRDVIATVLRVWSLSDGKLLRPSRLAKWKTFVQMGFVTATLIVVTVAQWQPSRIAIAAQWILDRGIITWAMGIVVALTVSSVGGYLQLLRR